MLPGNGSPPKAMTAAAGSSCLIAAGVAPENPYETGEPAIHS